MNPEIRTSEAIKMLSRAYNKFGGVAPDMAPDYNGIQAWIWVPSLYSAIEQGLKFLVRSHTGDSGWGHRLSNLYDSLSDKHRDQLNNAYEKYIELHDYIPYKTLKPFLDRLDVGPPGKGKSQKDQDGYTTWRYFLLDGFPKEEKIQPRVSIGAMLEVAVFIGFILEDEFISEGGEIESVYVFGRLYSDLHSEMFHLANSGEGVEKFKATYLLINRLITNYIDQVINFLRPGEDRESHPYFPYERISEDQYLLKICQFMRGRDRENYHQYMMKVRNGKLHIPNHKFVLSYPVKDAQK